VDIIKKFKENDLKLYIHAVIGRLKKNNNTDLSNQVEDFIAKRE
jgi:hypothetical protein